MLHVLSVRCFSCSARQTTLVRLGAWIMVAALIALNPQTSHADSFVEIEPNNTFGTGQLLVPTDGTITLTGFREAGIGLEYNDFFRFTATAGNLLTLRVVPVQPGGDSVLRLFNPAGALLAENDDCDDTPGFGSCIRSFSVTTTGLYGVGIRGFGNGTFNYTFTATGLTPTQTDPIPEPATMLLLGSGLVGIGALMRRRRHATSRTE